MIPGHNAFHSAASVLEIIRKKGCQNACDTQTSARKDVAIYSILPAETERVSVLSGQVFADIKLSHVKINAFCK